MVRLVLIVAGIVLASAWVVRRLLGIHRGRWVVTLVAAFAGQAFSIGIVRLVTGQLLDLPDRWIPVGAGLAIALATLIVVLYELVSRPGGRRHGLGIPHPIASISRWFARAGRYLQVSYIAIRRGLFAPGSDEDRPGSRLGRSLTATFEEAGGLFVKLGQAMASQPQLVTPAVAAELARLQDHAAVADPAAAHAVIEAEIGPPDQVFAAFSPEPVGSASIAQTYFAQLRDGRNVVVKVQRPGIRESVERDLDILIRLADRLDRRTAWANQISLKELVAGFAEATREELDFRIEAGNIVAAQRALIDSEPITVPGVIDAFTTSRVLVEERVEGRSVGSPGATDRLSLNERKAIADALLSLIVRQMVNGEPFHADPHPGNVFLRADGQLALIDYGSVGRLNRFERTALIDLLRGLQTQDPTLLRQAVLRIGSTGTRIDEDALDRELARLLTRAFRPDGSLNAAILGDILSIVRDFGIVLPRSTTTLFRTLVTLMGTLEIISPSYDLIDGGRRLGVEVIAPALLPGNFKELAQQEAITQAPILSRLPRDIDDVARSLLRGELRTRVSLLSEEDDLRAVRSMLNRLVMGLAGAALAIAGAILLTAQPRTGERLSVITILGGIGLFLSVLLLSRVVVQILRERG